MPASVVPSGSSLAEAGQAPDAARADGRGASTAPPLPRCGNVAQTDDALWLDLIGFEREDDVFGRSYERDGVPSMSAEEIAALLRPAILSVETSDDLKRVAQVEVPFGVALEGTLSLNALSALPNKDCLRAISTRGVFVRTSGAPLSFPGVVSLGVGAAVDGLDPASIGTLLAATPRLKHIRLRGMTKELSWVFAALGTRRELTHVDLDLDNVDEDLYLPVRDEDVRALSGLRLRWLEFSSFSWAGVDLSPIDTRDLELLRISGEHTGDAIRSLGAMPSLRMLFLYGKPITRADVANLHVPGLEMLAVCGGSMPPEAFAAFGSLSKLKLLRIDGERTSEFAAAVDALKLAPSVKVSGQSWCRM